MQEDASPLINRSMFTPCWDDLSRKWLSAPRCLPLAQTMIIVTDWCHGSLHSPVGKSHVAPRNSHLLVILTKPFHVADQLFKIQINKHFHPGQYGVISHRLCVLIRREHCYEGEWRKQACNVNHLRSSCELNFQFEILDLSPLAVFETLKNPN